MRLNRRQLLHTAGIASLGTVVTSGLNRPKTQKTKKSLLAQANRYAEQKVQWQLSRLTEGQIAT